MVRLLKLLIDIANHPDIVPELKEFTERGTVEILHDDPDLRVMVTGIRRVK